MKKHEKTVKRQPLYLRNSEKIDVLDWALETWSNSIVFTIWGFFLVIVVIITIRVFYYYF